MTTEHATPDTALFGAEFQALIYAERADFITEERDDGYVAFRDDMPNLEYHLRVTKAGPDGRYWWKRMRAGSKA
jgi:hypothetical protein